MTASLAHLAEIDAIEAKHANAKTQLDATLKEYKNASTRLEHIKKELAQVEKTLEGKHHMVKDEEARALRDINNQIATAQEELRLLKVKIKEHQAKHDNVVAGMAALQQRLRV